MFQYLKNEIICHIYFPYYTKSKLPRVPSTNLDTATEKCIDALRTTSDKVITQPKQHVLITQRLVIKPYTVVLDVTKVRLVKLVKAVRVVKDEGGEGGEGGEGSEGSEGSQGSWA